MGRVGKEKYLKGGLGDPGKNEKRVRRKHTPHKIEGVVKTKKVVKTKERACVHVRNTKCRSKVERENTLPKGRFGRYRKE